MASGSGISGACNVPRSLACCSSPYIEGFAGYTLLATNGAMGGRPNAHFMCNSEFPGSHLCHVAEYWRSHPDENPPAGGAWLDPSGAVSVNGGGSQSSPSFALTTPSAGRYGASNFDWNCNAWTNAAAGAGGIFVAPGTISGGPCTTVRALACCD